MGGKGRTETELLDGIVLLLLALAGLAERAAGRSGPVRWLALWRLWQAHAVVRDFVAGAAGRHWPPDLGAVRHGNDPADAMTLAASLRALALIVRTMAAHASRLSVQLQGEASGGHDAGQAVLDLVRRLGRVSSVERLDTS